MPRHSRKVERQVFAVVAAVTAVAACFCDHEKRSDGWMAWRTHGRKKPATAVEQETSPTFSFPSVLPIVSLHTAVVQDRLGESVVIKASGGGEPRHGRNCLGNELHVSKTSAMAKPHQQNRHF